MRQENLVQVAENQIEIHQKPATPIDFEDYLYEQHRDKRWNQKEQKQETPHTATFSRGCPDQ